MSEKQSSEDKYPIGGAILEAGNAEQYETGGWRYMKPILDLEKCTHCMLCWVACPDSAIIVENNKLIGFNMDHCKGCGMCEVECPDKIKAIHMVSNEEED